MTFDWRELLAVKSRTPAVVDPRRRLRIFLAVFLGLLGVVFARAVQLEFSYGAAFREVAIRPIEKQVVLPATRGRILSADGVLLAQDQTVEAVAVHYRSLQEPADAQWLLMNARSRLSKAERKEPTKLAAAKAAVLAERAEMSERLARLCGMTSQEWTARAQTIQDRVERIVQAVNARRQQEWDQTEPADDSWSTRLRRLLVESPAPRRLSVAEESAYHVMASPAPESALVEIKSHGERYPGVKIVSLNRRVYPHGALAAHLLGHLGPADKDDTTDSLVGRSGVEQQYEQMLRGRNGMGVERLDRSGRMLDSCLVRPPVPGHDMTLTIHAELQQTAEELLQAVRQRRPVTMGPDDPAGGAIVVMDVHNGAILAAASDPAFDPNLFVAGPSAERQRLLDAPGRPLFNRVCGMAIPPGSVFKVVTAAALLESGSIAGDESFFCRGYLEHPDRQRCQIFVSQGRGHGEVTLSDALCVSCNVYFFHFAGILGERPLLDWAKRFGFGRPTGVDLPGEAPGRLPSDTLSTADLQAMSIGQGALTATPLQAVCMIAAVANGGRLVPPHVKQPDGSTSDSTEKYIALPDKTIAGMRPQTLAVIGEGLRRVVADDEGTAHATVYMETIAVAGKTGTAEVGGQRASHAWFAGYVPADNPKLAFVIVLEHGGEAAAAAGPPAKRLVIRMDQLGLL